MDGLHEPIPHFDPYIENIAAPPQTEPVKELSEEEVVLLIASGETCTEAPLTPTDNPVVSALLGACSAKELYIVDEQPADQPAEKPNKNDKITEAVPNVAPEAEETPPTPAEGVNDGPIKPPTGGDREIASDGDDEGEPIFNEGYARPTDRPELGHYLDKHPETNVEAMVVVPHVPRLIGGIKSTQFVIKPEETTPDTPPDPNETIDLRTVAVPASELKNFADFFKEVEAQADTQYEVALLETQQMIADAEDRGVAVDTIFIPDSPNETADGYFRRLTRLAQDTNKTVVMRVVDYEDNYRFESYKRFEPVRAASAEAYWDQREGELGRMERRQGIEPEPTDHVAVGALQDVAMPPEGYWDHRDEYRALGDSLTTAAAASPENLQRWLADETSPLADKLSVIKEVASSTDSSLQDACGPARIILAKLGDPEMLQQILHEITTKTRSYGWESHTINPLGVYMRSDKALLHEVLGNVEQALVQGPNEPYELLSWLGALYHSFDPAIGPALADHLKKPDHHVENYAANALHAAGRWMPMYVDVLKTMPPSAERDTALEAIQTRTQTFLDAYNNGQLDGVYKYMMYWPADYLAPMLFDFHNPEHQSTLKGCVLQQFKDGGSVLNDRPFERLYIQYRQQYGDLPEITRHIHAEQ